MNTCIKEDFNNQPELSLCRFIMFSSGSSHVHSFRLNQGECKFCKDFTIKVFPTLNLPMRYLRLYSLDRLSPWGGGGGRTQPSGPTAAELWLSLTKIAKKEGLSSHYECA